MPEGNARAGGEFRFQLEPGRFALFLAHAMVY